MGRVVANGNEGTLVDHRGHLETLRTESDALVAAARREPVAIIRHCHPWRMPDLVRHTGIVQRSVVSFVEIIAAGEDPQTSKRRQMPMTPGDAEVVDWFAVGAGEAQEALLTLDPDGRLGERNPDRTIDICLSAHLAREVSLHRWDAEAAIGEPSALPEAAARDWLDGMLMSWLPCAAGAGRQAQGPWDGESFLFECSDGSDAWLVTIDAPGDVRPERGCLQADADVTVRGSASDLLLLAMNRIRPEALELAGATDLFARWRSEVRFGSPSR